jgi:hypothetical protein
MELSDIGRRIFGEHLALILGLVILGAGLGYLLHVGNAGTYTASARLVLDTPDPQTRAQATSIVDTARAIATSTSQVRAALRAAHVTGRDPVDVAKNHVSVTGLGASAILQLSVSDRDRQAAAAIANALASRVIDTRLEVSRGQLQQELPRIDTRIEELSVAIARLDVQIDSVNAALVTSGGSSTSALRAKRDAFTKSRDSLAQQRGILESERVDLVSANALRPIPSIISRAAIPTTQDPSRSIADAALGGILGLIVAIAVAGIIETVRPTLVGGPSLARELDTPLLGTLSILPADREDRQDLMPMKVRLRLASEAAGSESIGLLAADRSVDLQYLAEGLVDSRDGSKGPSLPHSATAGPSRAKAADSPSRIEARSTHGAHESRFDQGYLDIPIRTLSLDDSFSRHPDGMGVVLVSPTALKRSELLDIGQLLKLAPFPLLGLVTYSAPRPKRWPWLERGTLLNPGRLFSP